MDNYEISRDRAQAYFLNFDQDTIIRTWQLKSDAKLLYVDFLGRPYGVCRKTGKVTRLWDGTQAEHNEVLTIFDLLCHVGEEKTALGVFAPVNSLKGSPKAGGVETNFHSRFAALIDEAPQAFRNACLALGAAPVDMGDMGFQFPVFADLTVILKFYHSDEDFPAGLTFLWDENTLQYLYYETVFYVAGFLSESIRREMDKNGAPV